MFLAEGRPTFSLAKQRGFTLLEILISFFVLSIGLLGIISLTTLSKSTQHQALQRTRAIAMANDLLERIRSNPGGIETYALRNRSNPLGNNSTPTPSQIFCTHSTPCSTEKKALQDLWNWERMLDGNQVTKPTNSGGRLNTSGLIFPSACINFEPLPGKDRTGVVSVIIQWRGLTKLSQVLTNSDNSCAAMSSIENAYSRTIEVTTYLAGDLIIPTSLGEN